MSKPIDWCKDHQTTLRHCAAKHAIFGYTNPREAALEADLSTVMSRCDEADRRVIFANQRIADLEAEVEHLKANNRYQAGYAAGEREARAEVKRLRALALELRRDPAHAECRAKLEQAEGKLARVVKQARAACDNPCGCGSGKWPCHVDGDAACELVLSLATAKGKK